MSPSPFHWYTRRTGHGLSVPLEGFMDLVEKDYGIVEFKTSAQSMSQKDVDDHLQLTAYGYAYERLHQRPPKSYKIIDFVKTKSPKMIVLETRRKKADYARFYGIANQMLKGIEGESSSLGRAISARTASLRCRAKDGG